MNINDWHPISFVSLVMTGCIVGVYIPFIYFRTLRRKWNGWPPTKKFFAWLIGALYALPLAFNLLTFKDPNTTIADVNGLQLIGLAVLACSFGIYMPLAFLEIYRKSWHEWPWQTKVWLSFILLVFTSMAFSQAFLLVD